MTLNLGESLTGDKGHTWLRDDRGRSQGSCPIAMVTAVELSLALTARPGHPAVHSGYGKAETGGGAERRQVSHYSNRPASLLVKNPRGIFSLPA